MIIANPDIEQCSVSLRQEAGTKEDRLMRHETEPSLWLASLEMADGRRAQLVVHGDAEGEFPQIVDRGLREARSQAERAGVILPSEAYAYCLGGSPDGVHFLVAARNR
jgi:hypothetical protein